MEAEAVVEVLVSSVLPNYTFDRTAGFAFALRGRSPRA
jgi:hypothetical protein